VSRPALYPQVTPQRVAKGSAARRMFEGIVGLCRRSRVCVWLFILAWVLMVPRVGAGEGLRDPTRPMDFRAHNPSVPLALNSILIGDDRRLAIINGYQLAEGVVIPETGGVRLRRIQAQSVLLEQGDKRWRLSLPAEAEPIRANGTENN